MRLPLFLAVSCLISLSLRAAEPFEIREGDRVLFLGDTLLEREGTYGYLETRMHEQFPDRHFIVRNLSWSGETPRGWSRASFDDPDKGTARLKEDIAKVRPTVVFLGFGMAASLQEMTDRSADITLNRDPQRYGAEPMSAARFKRELGELMDAIEGTRNAERGTRNGADAASAPAPGSTGGSPVVTGGSPVTPGVERSPVAPTTPGVAGGPPATAGGPPALPSAQAGPVRFVLLSPIRHEDLRAVKPGLPDPAEHNKLLEQYAKAIEELAKERGGRFVSLLGINQFTVSSAHAGRRDTENGIHLTEEGYGWMALLALKELGLNPLKEEKDAELGEISKGIKQSRALRAAVIRKNELFFHQFRPANSTYLFGFRKHEQGQNAKEMPMFDPLIEAAEEEIDRLKKAAAAPAGAPSPERAPDVANPRPDAGNAGAGAATPRPDAAKARPDAAEARPDVAEARPDVAKARPDAAEARPDAAKALADAANLSGNPLPPLPDFTVEDGYQIELWAQNPYLEKPTQMNWDPQGRLWVCSSSLYPQIEPGQAANDKILILSDTNGDGKADKSEVFADGLLIPTGVVPDLSEGRAPARPTSTATDAPRATDAQERVPPSLSASACYVGQSTELLYFRDTDGDGKADEKRIVFSGFGTEDTHHIVHTLHWGPDGRLYFHQSVYIHTHLETPWGMVRLNSGGVFAYDPRTERVEVFIRGLWNTWGQAEDDWGQSFFTDGAGSSGISWGFPGAIFAPFEGSRRQMTSISPGSYPKFAGLEIVKSPHFPAEWQGNAVTCDFRAHRIVRFKIEDLSNAEGGRRNAEKAPAAASAVPRSALRVPRSGYTTTEQPDLVRTTDLSFRPIDVKLGPDGALYVADWSNPVINHGEVDFRDPRRDHHMGRIWRITKKGEPALKWEPLLGKKNEELLDKLLSKSAWEKENTRRILTELTPILENRPWISLSQGWLDAHRVDPVRGEKLDPKSEKRWTVAETALARRELALVDRLWAYPRLFVGVLQGEEDASGFRATSTRMLGAFILRLRNAGVALDDAGNIAVQLITGRSIDPNPRVRLEAMRTLARIPTAENASLVLDAAIKAPADDPHYDFAAWQSINDLAKPWTDALASGAYATEGREAQLAFGLKSIDPALAGAAFSKLFAAGKVPLDGPWIELIGDAGGPAELQRLLDGLLAGYVGDCCETDETRAIDSRLAFKSEVGSRKSEVAPTAASASAVPTSHFPLPTSASPAERAVAALQTAARVRNAKPAAHSELVTALFHAQGEIGLGAIRLAGLWHAPDAVEKIGELLDSRETKPPLRRAAVDGLRAAGGPDALGFLRVLTRAEETTDTRASALVAAVQVKLDAGLVLAAEVLPTFTDESVLLGTWRGLLGVKGAPDAFALKFGKQEVAKSLPAPVIAAAVRAAREVGRPGAKLLAALAPFAGASANAVASTDYPGLAAQTKQNGDPSKGELIYRRATSACVTCHAIGGAGGKVGPDMTSIGASAPLDYLIESILNPNAKVKEGYNAVSLTLADGTTATGIQARETASEVILRDAAGKESGVPKAAIKSKTDIGSMMPAGLTAILKPREAIDLYAFLSQLGKPGPYDASKGKVARVWRMYPGTAAGEVVSANYDPAKNPGFPGYTLVDGRFVKDLLAEATMIAAGSADTVLLATQFQSSGKTHLTLTGAGKAWLDGQPLVLGAELAPDLANGTHTLVVKIGVKELPEVLRAESADARFLGN